MIGNKLEQSIISVFQDDLSSTFSINQVSKILNKSYPLINRKSNFFLQEGILKKIDIGRSYQCFLNMHNDKTKVLMAVNEINKKESFIQKNKGFDSVMDELLQLTKKFNIDTILFYKKTILFVTSQIESKDEIMSLTMLTRDYNILFFDKSSFQQRFMNDKDLQKYHLVLYNVDIGLNIMAEVADNLLMNGLLTSKSNNGSDYGSSINNKSHINSLETKSPVKSSINLPVNSSVKVEHKRKIK